MSSSTQLHVNQLLQQGQQAFNGGKFDDAVRISSQILQTDPRHFNALQLAANASYRLGLLQDANKYLLQAIAIDGSRPELFNTQGCIAKDSGQYEQAEAAFSKAISLDPQYTSAQFNRALNDLTHRHFAKALTQIEQLLVINENYPNAMALKAECLEQLGQYESAIAAYRLAAEQVNDDIQPQLRLANALTRCRRLDEAETVYREVLSHQANDFNALINLGNIYLDKAQFDQALVWFEEVIKHYPGNAAALNCIGEIYERNGDSDKAAEYYLLAQKDNETPPIEALVNLAHVNITRGDYEKAEQLCLQAIELKPTFSRAYTVLSLANSEQGKLEEAERYLIQGLERNNRDPKAWYNLGVLYQGVGRHKEAILCYENTLEIAPDYLNAAFNMSSIYLTMGDFERGWHYYFQRPRYIPEGIELSPFSPDANYAGKRILLVHAQGIGDELLFLRYAELLIGQGATLSYFSSPKPASLFQRCELFSEVHRECPDTETFDYLFSVDDLPLITNATSATDIPHSLCLSPLPDRMSEVKKTLASFTDKPVIGICWRAGTAVQKNNQENVVMLKKAISLDDFIRLLPEDGKYVILQRNPQPEEIRLLEQAFPNGILDMNTLNDDLEGMLALLACLDDVIGVSNTNVHLLASLGKTGQVLIPYPPDWRWMQDRETSPWFPEFKTLRQTPEGQWPPLS